MAHAYMHSYEIIKHSVYKKDLFTLKGGRGRFGRDVSQMSLVRNIK